MSWSFTTDPIEMPNGLKDSSRIVIDSTKVSAAAWKALEDYCFGTEQAEAQLPTPTKVLELAALTDEVNPDDTNPDAEPAG
jgi:hypothetical protein